MTLERSLANDLFKMSKKTKIPATILLDEAVEQYMYDT